MKPRLVSPRPACQPTWTAVWAPWLAAPLFTLLPIVGCGIGGGLRPATCPEATAGAASVLPAVSVVPVVPPPIRQVAWGRGAD